MILTKYADYSVRVLLYLGARPNEKIPINVIADSYGISRNHLMKVSQNLARHGFITGYRGKGGGITLARSARNISLGEILALVEPNLRTPAPPEGDRVELHERRFHEVLVAGRDALVNILASCTLADLLGPQASNEPPCQDNGARGT